MARGEGDQAELTRRQRREAAREERRALEQAEAAAAVRRTRLTQLGIVGAIVIAVIVGILIATGSGGAKKVKPHSPEAIKTTAEVASLLNGIPQSGKALGSPTAPVTLQYFGDLECSVCQKFTLGALPQVIKNWVRPGKLRIEYHSLETATRDPEVFKDQQTAALAASKQQKMWDFVEVFYHEQGGEGTGYVNEAFLQNIAQQVPGLNLAQWTSDRNDPAFVNDINSDAQAANNSGFKGTPSFLIGKTGSTLGTYEAPSLEEAGPWNEEIEKLIRS
jgi:protein-disulfide isomerase